MTRYSVKLLLFVKLSLAAFAFAIVAASIISPANAANRNCTAKERAAADKELWLNTKDKGLAVRRHLPWGTPKPDKSDPSEVLLVQRDYVNSYDEDLRIPLWSAERIVAARFKQLDRINCFRRDPRLKAPVASSPADYKEPIFDQGHMTPNGDMSISATAIINSFIMSNMTPQYCQLNRGVWQILEVLVRHWAQEYKTVYVITGSIMDRDGDGKRDTDNEAKRMKSNNGKQRVAIPTSLYKIIAHKRADGSLEVLTVVLPNDQTDLDGKEAVQYISSHIRSVSDVSKVTGLTFFPNLDKPLHEAATSALWDIGKTKFRSLVNADCRKTAGMYVQ